MIDKDKPNSLDEILKKLEAAEKEFNEKYNQSNLSHIIQQEEQKNAPKDTEQ